MKVAGHLPLRSHSQLVRALASRVRDGGYLLFSAAPPGMFTPLYDDEDEYSRGAALHKANRSPCQWRREIERHTSLVFDHERTAAVRAASGRYLAASLMVFRRERGCLIAP